MCPLQFPDLFCHLGQHPDLIMSAGRNLSLDAGQIATSLDAARQNKSGSWPTGKQVWMLAKVVLPRKNAKFALQARTVSRGAPAFYPMDEVIRARVDAEVAAATAALDLQVRKTQTIEKTPAQVQNRLADATAANTELHEDRQPAGLRTGA